MGKSDKQKRLVIGDKESLISKDQRKYGAASDTKKQDFFDEILSVEYMKGFRHHILGNTVYWLLAICTAGLSLLFFHWFARIAIKLRYRRCDIDEASRVFIKGIDKKTEFCKVSYLDTVEPPIKMLVYRHTRLFFNEETHTFERRLRGDHSLEEVRQLLTNGVPPNERNHIFNLIGPNVIDFPVPSIPKLLLQEVLHPFFIFQIYSVILWCFEDYYYYAGAILFIALVSIGLTLKETRANLLNLQRIARFECPVQLLSNGQFSEVSSANLIPGDIIELTQKLILPCDVALLQGQAVLNESMLTGESIPVIKVPIGLEGEPHERINVGDDPRTIAFGGTHVLKLQPGGANKRVLGMVLKCGFETSKGALILSILFPKPSHFKFFTESLKFLGVLCVIGLIGFGVSVYRLLSVGEPLSTVFIRALDLITIVVPPALPMAMTVGTGFALMRLKKQNIYCISPPRINMAGKIEVFCFDKTGTLTEEGLDLLGLHPAADACFTEFTTDLSRIPKTFLHTMATCHTITTVEGEHIGDPLEIRVFHSTNASIHDGHHDGYSATVRVPKPADDSYNMVGHASELGLVERFEFQSALQRMSVIVQEIGVDKPETMVYVKGSPEMISMLSIPETIPHDFATLLDQYTNKGYRVLACGYRRYDGQLKGIRKETLRKQVESELVFLGFIVMENKLKPETPKTLTVLKDARIRCIMVTGDNALTAVSVARECGLIDPNLTVFMGDRISDGATGLSTIQWNDVSSDPADKKRLDPHTLKLENNGKNFGNYALAVTGKVWETLFEECQLGNKVRFLKMLEKGAVFARMTPDQKAALIEELQRLGLYVAMCGDGANDCGALKAAHVGISLSEAEASIAAPFTSTRPNITCTPNLIREGRASLAVSFKLFQFMGMYSMIQFTSVIILYFKDSVLGNWQYLFEDLIVVFPLVIFMGKTTPCRTLSVKRPSGRLVSGAVVGSLLGHILICAAFQLLSYFLLVREPWYTPGTDDPDGDDENIRIYEMVTLFAFANFQYLMMALIYSWGKPFLNPIYTNYYLFGTYLTVLGVSLFLLFGFEPHLWIFLQLRHIPIKWAVELFLILLVNFVCCAGLETAVYLFKNKRKFNKPKHKTTFDP